MISAWMLAAALAAPCGDLAGALRGAQAAFDDAELDVAATRLQEAEEALLCQASPVSLERLRALYHLRAVVAVARGQGAEAQVAVVRAVTVSPDVPPDPGLGPDVRALWDRWKARLDGARVDIGVRGGGELWLDGVPLRAGERASVVPGEHLVTRAADGVTRASLVEIVGSTTLDTGIPGEAPVLAALPAAAAPAPVPARRAGPNGVVLGVGLGLFGLGAGAAIAGGVVEGRFMQAPYDDAMYGSCRRRDPCYDEAREAVIQQDAAGIRALYGVGFGLLGVGAVIAGTSFAVTGDQTAVKVSLTRAF